MEAKNDAKSAALFSNVVKFSKVNNNAISKTMAFTEKLEFKDVSKLLEALSTTKLIKKRDEYAFAYFNKLNKFHDEFKEKNKGAVSEIELRFL